jgi:nucleotide-binding universal stress UspA family protein
MSDKLRAVEKYFRHATAGVKDLEWRGRMDFPSDILEREARAADLIIVGRDAGAAATTATLNPGATVLRMGCPVLVVPDGIAVLRARHIVIAWKDTREARRAVRDAIPFLQDAQEVLIIEVGDQGAEPDAQKRLDDVSNYLARHRVVFGAKVIAHARTSAADEIIRFATAEKSDLIVAGGYGHSRLGEWIFGGATRHLLSSSPVCCLLSH